MAAVCQPVVLAKGQIRPSALAIDSTNVYWTNEGDGTVNRIPIGGGTLTVMASSQGTPAAIAVDGTNVYWTDTTANAFPTPSLVRQAIVGGTTFAIATSASANSITVDATTVYWTVAGGAGVTQIAKTMTNGMGTTLVTGYGVPFAVAVDSANVYWTVLAGGYVYKVPIGGGTPVAVASGQLGAVSLAANATSLYWTSDETIDSAPIGGLPDGGAPAVLATSTQATVEALAIDATNVYWVDNGGGVSKAPIGGGGPTVALASGQLAPVAVAVDATSVYWANQGTAANNYSDGAIVKMAK